MKFTDTRIPGVVVIEPDVFDDDRGQLVVAWLPSELAARGLDATVVQGTMASNRVKGTIRGLHYQAAPFQEAKTIRVTRGAIFDVAVDLRPDSPTYLSWVGFELSATNKLMMHVPIGCAHGYQTLADESEVFYFVSARYSPPDQRGARWDDPAFGIEWPLGPPTRISARDAAFPDIAPLARR